MERLIKSFVPLPRPDKCAEVEFEAKMARTLKIHKAFVHDIDVVYYPCNVKGCNYEAKSSSNQINHEAACVRKR